jgi:hypothetical protein
LKIIVHTINLFINWKCKHNWKIASKNTSWCLLGCAIGDLGTIAFFQFSGIYWPVFAIIMSLAIINGLITSIILETAVLSRQMPMKLAFKIAIGMSLISMVSMEIAMNATDVLLTGEAILEWWVVPIMLFSGFITPYPVIIGGLKRWAKPVTNMIILSKSIQHTSAILYPVIPMS